MSEDRETHQITTPIKNHTVILRSWINGREKQKIDGTMFSNIDTVGEGNNMKPVMSESMIANRENASIDVVVVSVDGNENDVVNQVLDMRATDYEFVLKHVEEVTEGGFDEKKETASVTSITKSSAEEKDESTTPVSV